MIDPAGFGLISIVALCFGLIISFQIAHIHYARKLIKLAKRSIDSGTLAPIFAELERLTGSL